MSDVEVLDSLQHKSGIPAPHGVPNNRRHRSPGRRPYALSLRADIRRPRVTGCSSAEAAFGASWRGRQVWIHYRP